MKALNLYAGLGGNRRGWDSFDMLEVTAVELDERVARVYADNFPDDTVIIGDAHQYLIDHYSEFDIIWASPPCPTHSRMQKATRHDTVCYPDMSLYQEIILLEHRFDGRWVVENVVPYYEPLIPARQIGRHLFWSNFQISANHHPSVSNMINADSPDQIEHLKKVMGITYDGSIYLNGNHSPGQALRNCVLPELSAQVMNSCLLSMSDMFGVRI